MTEAPIIKGGDDYAMLRETLTRRFARLQKEEGPWPDLVMIDGGAGHLTVTTAVFEELGITDVPYVCIAKGRDRNAGREWFHLPTQSPFQLPPHDPVLHYLQRLRDEAHRFAIGTHRAKRSKELIKNPLDEISGIGAKRKKALLHHFGSARPVGQASLTDLLAVHGVAELYAQRRIDHFFVSPNINVTNITVPATELDRIASDQLPLIIDVQSST